MVCVEFKGKKCSIWLWSILIEFRQSTTLAAEIEIAELVKGAGSKLKCIFRPYSAQPHPCEHYP